MESDPEKAKFATPAKTLEAVEGKIAKPGFETSIRIIAVSTSEDLPKAMLPISEVPLPSLRGT